VQPQCSHKRYEGNLAHCAAALRYSRPGHRAVTGTIARVLGAFVSRRSRRFPWLFMADYRSPPFRPLSEDEDAAINAACPNSRVGRARRALRWMQHPRSEWVATIIDKTATLIARGV
jgi:hypothetical protein